MKLNNKGTIIHEHNNELQFLTRCTYRKYDKNMAKSMGNFMVLYQKSMGVSQYSLLAEQI